MKKKNGLSYRKSTHTAVKTEEIEEDKVKIQFLCWVGVLAISIDLLIGSLIEQASDRMLDWLIDCSSNSISRPHDWLID